ncbi:hypothetical protein O7627_27390 [Solwaraspora sp. WMMD1047]|uniref:hypothetical protein n=1 Tax=Solwaraspora sp. WMMD1047 TaxID=3016102 RepID=UPI0024164DC2|nr:hypothetical protein [Solwaraspora sp. WMMD1047]MDG4833001.1 hypothetical protein [Solwaraspora sp. WMMD1047]
MNLGECLVRAADLIGQAADHATSGGCTSHGQAAHALAARDRTYRGLRHLVDLLAFPDEPVQRQPIEQLVDGGGRLDKLQAIAWLRGAVDRQIQPSPPPVSRVSSPSPIVGVLRGAGDSVLVAGDILASHVGDQRPATPEGIAIRNGAGRAGALADLATLALAARMLDERLARWLGAGTRDRTIGALYAQQVAYLRRQDDRDLDAGLRRIAATPGHRLLHLLQVAPAPAPDAYVPVATLQDVTGVISAVRALGVRDPRRLDLAHATEAARLAVLVAGAATFTWSGAQKDESDGAVAALAKWREVATVLGNLGPRTARRSDPTLQRLLHSADIVRSTLGRPSALIHVPTRQVLDEQARLLPGLAHSVLEVTRSLTERRLLCVTEKQLASTSRGGIFYATEAWTRAGPAHSAIATIVRGLNELRRHNFIMALGVGARSPTATVTMSFDGGSAPQTEATAVEHRRPTDTAPRPRR